MMCTIVECHPLSCVTDGIRSPQTFRILDAKDGKVDGVISLAKGVGRPNPNKVSLTGTAKKALLM